MKWSFTVRELLALHECFRKMGYPADELFVASYRGNSAVQFVLDRGGKKFTIDIAQGLDLDAVLKEWPRAAAWWNSPTTKDSERASIYNGSEFMKNKGGLVAALVMRGFIAPNTLN